MARGKVRGSQLKCGFHNWDFNLTSGYQALINPLPMNKLPHFWMAQLKGIRKENYFDYIVFISFELKKEVRNSLGHTFHSNLD